MEIKKNYLILGDNNFWYSTLFEVTEEQLNYQLDNIKKQINDDHSSFASPLGGSADELGVPYNLFVYEFEKPFPIIKEL